MFGKVKKKKMEIIDLRSRKVKLKSVKSVNEFFSCQKCPFVALVLNDITSVIRPILRFNVLLYCF